MPYLQIIRNSPPSVWERVREALRSYSLGPLSLKDRELSRKLGWGGGSTLAGVSVTAESAMGVPAVRRAVLAIAGDVGTLPLFVSKRLPTGGKERDTSHRLHGLLHDRANRETTAAAFREAMQVQAALLGNAYAEIERDNGGRAVALWPLAPGQCTPDRDSAGRLFYRVVGSDGRLVPLDVADVLHLKGPSTDGTTGINPLVQAREAIAVAIATEQHVASFFGNGAQLGGVLSHPKTLSPTAMKSLRDSFEAMHRGSDRAHRMAVLEEGMSYQPSAADPEKSQLQAAREFCVREMARVFGVPPSRLADAAGLSFATSENESLAYFTTTIRPWLVRWEQELMAKLLTSVERQTYVIEHNHDALLRSDSTSRANFVRTMVAAGVYTRNECRALEGLPALDGGDVLTAPLNTGPLPGEATTTQSGA